MSETHCSFSTGIDGSITAGRGKLSDNGYWEFPCQPCADRANVNRRNAEQISKLSAELSTLQAALAQATKERDEARKDASFHADCRPNRKQAEAWRDDAKAMNDKWADEWAARVTAESSLAKAEAALAQVQGERDTLQQEVYRLMRSNARLDDALKATMSKERP